jgi:hypothetical protein
MLPLPGGRTARGFSQHILERFWLLRDHGRQCAERLAGNGQTSIVGHFQFQISNHLEMLAILAHEREPFFEGTRGDQGIERLQSMRARRSS